MPSSLFPPAQQSKLRGRLQFQAPLGLRSWFRVGGTVEYLYQPADEDDLSFLLQNLPPDLPVVCLGACSNVILRDGGIFGLVIRLGRNFASILADGDGLIVGGGCLDVTVAEMAAKSGIGGMEFLIGIPGTIGGAITMNAGAHGSDMAALVDWVDILTREGQQMRLLPYQLGFGYRHSNLPTEAIVIKTRLKGHKAKQGDIRLLMNDIKSQREETQPIRSRTGGSTFRNPSVQECPMKAWELIDMAGCRGLSIGGAQISEKHCNFMINMGHATAFDLESLGEEVRRRVRIHSGIKLQWEIRRIGVFAPNQTLKADNYGT